MEHPIEPLNPPPSTYPPGPVTPRAAGTRRVPRPWVHLALLVVSSVTLWAAGVFWEPPASLSLPDLLQSAGRGFIYVVCTLLILGAHEFGHYFACRYYGIPATLPYFIPGIPPIGSFGAVIRIRGPIPNRNALFDVAAAGPIAGFVVAFPILIIGVITADAVPAELPVAAGWILGEPLILVALRRFFLGDVQIFMNVWLAAAWVGMLVTSLNLFPVGQLDGGHAAYAFSRRVHRTVTVVTLIGLFAAILFQALALGVVPAYVLWFVILLWMRDRHPRLIDESRPLGRGRRWVAAALVLIFVASFIFLPIRVV